MFCWTRPIPIYGAELDLGGVKGITMPSRGDKYEHVMAGYIAQGTSRLPKETSINSDLRVSWGSGSLGLTAFAPLVVSIVLSTRFLLVLLVSLIFRLESAVIVEYALDIAADAYVTLVQRTGRRLNP